MSNEQNDNDTLVSATYRESAQETTPPQLNEAVLRMAADQKPARVWEGFSAWVRPLTWAATAGLVAAIMINVPIMEDTTDPIAPASESPAASIEEAFAADSVDVVEEAEKMASLRDGPDQAAPSARTRQELATRLDEDSADAAVASRSFNYSAPATAERCKG